MAININLPKVPPAHDDYHMGKAAFSVALLNSLHGTAMPASHQNQLFDNMMGVKPHTFSPTDIANNPVNSH